MQYVYLTSYFSSIFVNRYVSYDPVQDLPQRLPIHVTHQADEVLVSVTSVSCFLARNGSMIMPTDFGAKWSKSHIAGRGLLYLTLFITPPRLAE